MVWLVIAGVLQAVSLAWPVDGAWRGVVLPGVQWLALSGFAWAVLHAPRVRTVFWQSWAFASAWLVGATWWLYISLHRYGGMPSWLAVLAVLLLAVGLALPYAALLAWHRRHCPVEAAPWRHMLGFAAAWTLAELFRGHIATGFPWGAIGYAHVEGPLRVWAPWLGVYGVGAVAAALAAATALTVQRWRTRSARQALTSSAAAGGFVVLALSLGLHVVGPQLSATPGDRADAKAPPALHVRLLQGNVPQDLKFNAAAQDAVRDYREALLASPAALTVTPETAIPYLPEQLPADVWHGLRERPGQAVLIGSPLRALAKAGAAGRYTNAAWAIVPGAAETYRYDKQHLVPFGEFVPPLFQWFVDQMHIPLGEFVRGAPVQMPLAWQGQRIAPNICFEDLFGEELARQFNDPAQAPTLLLNLSNLAWFGDTVALDQHLHISRMRALELQRPLLRATNTGATAVIDAQGRVLQRLPYNTRGALDAEVQGQDGPPTFYARWAGHWGLWPLALCMALLWAVAAGPGLRRPSRP